MFPTSGMEELSVLCLFLREPRMHIAPEDHSAEIRTGQRFRFGQNWQEFLRHVDDGVIERAQISLLQPLGVARLDGVKFLDAGCGSGLSSLAARRAGATVCSFDFDPQAVACTQELKSRYSPGDESWTIRQGSVLDESLGEELGEFDVVYAWGMLHHTGHMWTALERVLGLVAGRGKLFVALYNDQGGTSVRWKRIKQCYNKLPSSLRFLILWPAFLRIWGPTTVRDFLRGRPFQTWRDYPDKNRGMRPWRDVVDWVGGFPFDVARPEQVVEFCHARGLALCFEKTCGRGRGCNEFVFQSEENLVTGEVTGLVGRQT